ncbi:hypothetical protein K443DRAFT_121655 [Laccaria amethystina LaAM-08-1]|uniref:Unplaced genomic scaffold K443scaffold_49, whole genome shotgun sequence n=1 Tax=Laccaria amethystina LaAM-08-1 TaxID=1095629 RepID=A0A0C9WUW4_9AGAR|nr:hypothetical protein K443DRAFT_121655 [Laccaria amethystina LaAM-08-1]
MCKALLVLHTLYEFWDTCLALGSLTLVLWQTLASYHDRDHTAKLPPETLGLIFESLRDILMSNIFDLEFPPTENTPTDSGISHWIDITLGNPLFQELSQHMGRVRSLRLYGIHMDMDHSTEDFLFLAHPAPILTNLHISGEGEGIIPDTTFQGRRLPELKRLSFSGVNAWPQICFSQLTHLSLANQQYIQLRWTMGEFIEALNDCPCLVELHLLMAGPLSSSLSIDEASTHPQGILLNHLSQINFREMTRVDNPGDLLCHLKYPNSTLVILQPAEPFTIQLFESMFTPPLLPPCLSHAQSMEIMHGEMETLLICEDTVCLQISDAEDDPFPFSGFFLLFPNIVILTLHFPVVIEQASWFEVLETVPALKLLRMEGPGKETIIRLMDVLSSDGGHGPLCHSLEAVSVYPRQATNIEGVASRVIIHKRPMPCLPCQFIFHQQVMPVRAPIQMASLF